MIKVLQIGLSSNPGGVESLVLNYNKYIKKDEFIFDYVDLYGEGIAFENEIKMLGGSIYTIPNYKKHPIKAISILKKIVFNYDIVHIHMQSAANIIPIIASRGNKKCTIICHSHSSSTPKGFLRKLLNKINVMWLRKINVIKWACGVKAGQWMWGNEFDKDNIIENAIDYDQYKFDATTRRIIRTKCGFNDSDKVIGFVGRFGEEKNVFFLIKVLQELKKISDEYKLLTVGGNELYYEFEKKISELEIDDLYYSAGIQKNASAWYQAMDALLLPSFFEGFPMVCVEGQASGLPCFLSNNISNEISITNKVKFIPIEKYDEVKWAKEIDNDLRDMRRNNADFPKEYILKYAVKRLQDKYRELLKQ